MVLENASAVSDTFGVPPQTKLIVSLLLLSRWQYTSFSLIYKNTKVSFRYI